jgi:hypothetical protein
MINYNHVNVHKEINNFKLIELKYYHKENRNN